MTRVTLINSRAQLAPEHHDIYDSISSTRGFVAGPFALLLHEPELAARIAHLGSHIRFESTLAARDREIVILVVASEMKCEYEWHFHAPVAVRAGVPNDAIAAIRNGEELQDGDGQLGRYVRDLVRSHQTDPGRFDILLSRFGVPGLVTLTATIGYYVMLACLLNAFDIPADTKQS